MTFLDATPHVAGPNPRVEEEYGFYGFVWTLKRRTNLELRLTWAVGEGGTDQPPTTYVFDSVTYTLVTGDDGRGHGDATGVCTAIYRKLGSWAWVP